MSDWAKHLFLSYARKDNEHPVNDAGEGWVTAFDRELRERHKAYSGRELNIFFDTDAIDPGVDWRRRLSQGLRQSRLLLAFLSPNYITSPNCLWEWEEYLRYEHSSARGDDGLTPIFFITPSDLSLGEKQQIADWLTDIKAKYPHLRIADRLLAADDEQRTRQFSADLSRRNRTSFFELQPWFEQGPQVLQQLDAAERSAEVKAAGRNPEGDLRTLADRLQQLDRHIAWRLDRLALADLAPGNVARGHEHFVGRHRELSTLHTILTQGGPQSGGSGMGGRGMIAATHSPGGLGKTALARQYCHAYAEFYACGGTWELACEGVTHIGAALLKLAERSDFQRLGAEVGIPLRLPDEVRADYAAVAAEVFDYLRVVTAARQQRVLELLKAHPERHTSSDDDLPEIEQPRALLLLDNVDQPELLSAAQVGQWPAAEWLEILVTTRLDPTRFGIGDRWQAPPLEIDPLPDSDALELIRDYQPNHCFTSPEEEEAAARIVEALGGHTLAVELAAAYLNVHAGEGLQPSVFVHRLEQEAALTVITPLPGESEVATKIRHAQKRVPELIDWSLARLSPPARTALNFAALLQPDQIPLLWLKILTQQQHPEELQDQEGYPAKWPGIWRELHGLRLLQRADGERMKEDGTTELPTLVRIHRLTAEHVAANDPNGAETWQALDEFITAVGTMFERGVGQGDDAWLRWQHPWLLTQMEFLLDPVAARYVPHEPMANMLRAAHVAANFEAQHSSLARGIALTEKVNDGFERLLADSPDSAQAARDVSVSLNKLGDFLSTRGGPGDAEQALEYYMRSLEVRERLLVNSPDSALAARDVSVSLTKLAAVATDHEKALQYALRDLEIALNLKERNPQSLYYQRDAAVSFGRTARYANAAGNQELAGQCLAGCFSILDPLVKAGYELDPAMRQLHAQLAAMFQDGGPE
ncbi:MAG: TIR domain-containing protein [Planctomycetaceae bacterium]|nr:TIR domain-containing protein [Planctomycetaceae bacterium]